MARSKYKRRIIGFVLKGLCTLIIISIAGLLVWRMLDNMFDPQIMNTVVANEKLADAYDQKGDGLDAYYQEHSQYTRGDTNYGYFAITQSLIISDIDQVQFVMRYNNSTLEYTKNDFQLSEIPKREDIVYEVILTVMYDLTPDNKDDNDGKTPDTVKYETIGEQTACVKAQKTLYNYRKYVFDGVKIDENVIAIYADFYYVGDFDPDEKPYGSLLIYHCDEKKYDYKFTADDIKALESFK